MSTTQTQKTAATKTKAATTTKTAAKTEAKAAPTTAGVYRQNPEFLPALKSAKALAKGNGELGRAIQLMTHLAWKKPTDTVGWTAGTTASVIEYADDIATPVGTPISEAFATVIKVAQGAAVAGAQADALDVLVSIVRKHEGS